MNTVAASQSPVPEPRDRIILALDVSDAGRASALVREMNGRVGAFKVGLELYVSAGPEFVRSLCDAGAKIFLDLKFHDIPNTVAKAVAAASKLGVWMLNVHASGGAEMMSAAAEAAANAAEQHNLERPRVIGVTVLTSSDESTLASTGITRSAEEQAAALARLAARAGLDGVVASPRDVSLIRARMQNGEFLIVTPGIRPYLATPDDQKRVTTFGQAMSNGSDYVVIGRPITGAADRVATLEAILSEV